MTYLSLYLTHITQGDISTPNLNLSPTRKFQFLMQQKHIKVLLFLFEIYFCLFL